MKIGLALSGGGVKGIAHAGALQAFNELNIPIHIIGGTSSGSLVAALYAMGYSPYYIYFLFQEYAKQILGINYSSFFPGVHSFFEYNKNKQKGLKDSSNLEKLVNHFAKKKNIFDISDISMPLVIPTVDIKSCKKYVFTNYIPDSNSSHIHYINEGTIGQAVRASSSFPAIFCPCNIKNHCFLDGGVLDNIPIQEIKKQGAEYIIGLKFQEETINHSSNLMDIVMKTIDIMGNEISKASFPLCNVLLSIPIKKCSLLDINQLETCFISGYQCIMNSSKELKNIVKRSNS